MTVLRQFPVFIRVSLMIAASLWMVSCSDASNDADETETRSAEEIYTQARGLLAERQYTRAAAEFDEVERQYPYSPWAARSQIMSAYSYYKLRKYDDTINTLARFIDMYPAHDSLDYAYYLTALSYYEQISDVGRDQGMTRKARGALRDVVRRFPNSDYARDAQLKMDLTNDHLAGKEMMVGRYYVNKKEYIAAANRFRTVIEQFETTSHTPEALHRLVEVYLLLGVRDQAKRYAAVLGHNYPGSAWYQRSYDLLGGNESAGVAPDATKARGMSAPEETPAITPEQEESGWFDW